MCVSDETRGWGSSQGGAGGGTARVRQMGKVDVQGVVQQLTGAVLQAWPPCDAAMQPPTHMQSIGKQNGEPSLGAYQAHRQSAFVLECRTRSAACLGPVPARMAGGSCRCGEGLATADAGAGHLKPCSCQRQHSHHAMPCHARKRNLQYA